MQTRRHFVNLGVALRFTYPVAVQAGMERRPVRARSRAWWRRVHRAETDSCQVTPAFEGDDVTMTAERTELGREIETALGEVLAHVRGESELPCRIVETPAL